PTSTWPASMQTCRWIARPAHGTRPPDDRLVAQDPRGPRRARTGADAGGHPRRAVRADSARAAGLPADFQFLDGAADPAAHLLHAAAAGLLHVPVAAAGRNAVPPRAQRRRDAPHPVGRERGPG